MSTHYDIACLDCGIEAGVGDRFECRNEAALQYVVNNKTVFAGLSPLSYSYLRIGGGRVETSWLHEHQQHELAVISCYQTIDDLRDQSVTTAECKRCKRYVRKFRLHTCSPEESV